MHKKGYNRKMLHKKLALILVLIISLTGCARTLRVEETQNLKLTLTFTFMGNTNTTDAVYIIPFSKRPSPIIFFQPNTTELSYMPIPGFLFDPTRLPGGSTTLKPFYDQVYTTWDQFIIIYDNKIELIKGIPLGTSITAPFTVTDNIGTFTEQQAIHEQRYPKSETFRGVISSTNGNNTLTGLNTRTLTLTLEISQLGYVENDLIFYGLMSLRKSDFIAGLYQDSTNPKGQQFPFNIPLSKNQKRILSGAENSSIPQSMDLISWQAEVL